MKENNHNINQKHTHRGANLKTDLTKRLLKIEGQIRGINKMVSEDIYCVDIFNQIRAVESALLSVQNLLLEDHLKGCVMNGIKRGNLDVLDEMMDIIRRITK